MSSPESKQAVLGMVSKILDEKGIDTPLGLALDLLARESDVFLVVMRIGDRDPQLINPHVGTPITNGQRAFATAGQGHSDRQLRAMVTKWLTGRLKRS